MGTRRRPGEGALQGRGRRGGLGPLGVWTPGTARAESGVGAEVRGGGCLAGQAGQGPVRGRGWGPDAEGEKRAGRDRVRSEGAPCVCGSPAPRVARGPAGPGRTRCRRGQGLAAGVRSGCPPRPYRRPRSRRSARCRCPSPAAAPAAASCCARGRPWPARRAGGRAQRGPAERPSDPRPPMARALAGQVEGARPRAAGPASRVRSSSARLSPGSAGSLPPRRHRRGRSPARGSGSRWRRMKAWPATCRRGPLSTPSGPAFPSVEGKYKGKRRLGAPWKTEQDL